jgi:2-amino-4-hydroxy-6-hydroxymethyldihydropteridine diphosphokinase
MAGSFIEFPLTKAKPRAIVLFQMKTAYIGMGANLPGKAGSPQATLAAAALRLESLGKVASRSSLYSTEPVGFAEQPRFINAVVALETELEPRELLQRLLAIEAEFGRDRSAGIANGPRTLDLDLLLFGDLTLSEPGLEIPHPRLAERTFVLVPLCEIAPQILYTGHGKTVSQLLHSLLPGSESTIHAVVQVQYDGWRAGAGGGVACPGEPERTVHRDIDRRG